MCRHDPDWPCGPCQIAHAAALDDMSWPVPRRTDHDNDLYWDTVRDLNEDRHADHDAA